MNWNRILDTMLIIFIVLNILIFGYSKLSTQNQYVLSYERESLLKEIMYDEGITMYNFYPSYEPMASLIVQVPDYDREAIITRIFDGMDYVSDRELTIERVIYDAYSYNNQTLVFYSGNYAGLIDYKGPSPLYQVKAFEENSVTILAKEFADDLIGSIAPLEVYNVYYDEELEQYHVLLNQVDDEILMLCDYVEVVISEDGIVSARASVYPIVSRSGEKKELYPIDEVLYKWMDTIDVASNELARIKSIDIGYHIGLDELNKDASIEAVPYYQIIMQDGTMYDISAYTNQLIKETFIGAISSENMY